MITGFSWTRLGLMLLAAVVAFATTPRAKLVPRLRAGPSRHGRADARTRLLVVRAWLLIAGFVVAVSAGAFPGGLGMYVLGAIAAGALVAAGVASVLANRGPGASRKGQ